MKRERKKKERSRLSPVSYTPHEGQYEPGEIPRRRAAQRGNEATIFDPRRDKASVGAAVCGRESGGWPSREQGRWTERARVPRGIICASCVRRGRGRAEGEPTGPCRLKAPLGARNIKRGLSCSREWRILCRFLVDRAPDSIAAAIGCAPGTGLIKIVGVPGNVSLSLLSSTLSLVLVLALFLSEILSAVLPRCVPLVSLSPRSPATFLSFTATSPSRLSLYLAVLLLSSFFFPSPPPPSRPVPHRRRGCASGATRAHLAYINSRDFWPPPGRGCSL